MEQNMAEPDRPQMTT